VRGDGESTKVEFVLQLLTTLFKPRVRGDGEPTKVEFVLQLLTALFKPRVRGDNTSFHKQCSESSEVFYTASEI
jgi:hypothetical protein